MYSIFTLPLLLLSLIIIIPKQSQILKNIITFIVSFIPIILFYKIFNIQKLFNSLFSYNIISHQTILTLEKIFNIIFKKNNLIYESKEFYYGITFAFQFNDFGNIFILLVLILYPITTIYSIAYFTAIKDNNADRFHFLTCCAIVCLMLLLLANNLFTSFVFYEILTLITYFLVIHNNNKQSRNAGLKYLFYLIFASMLLLLPAIIYIYEITGILTYQSNGIFNAIPISQYLINILVAMIIFGIAKTAILPLNDWLISAMAAPAPVSALLHAVIVVKSGIFLLYKIFYDIFGIELLRENLYYILEQPWPVFISIATMLFANLSAILVNNIKKRLAYSTMSQLSYMTLFIFLLPNHDKLPIFIIIFVAHSLAKLNLFFYSGYLYVKHEIITIDDLKIYNRLNFLTIFAFTIPIISLIGLPPTLGYIAKYNYIITILNKKSDLIILLVIFISTITTIIYLNPLFYCTFFNDRKIKNDNNLLSNIIKGKNFETQIINIMFYISTLIPSLLLIILWFCLE